MDNLAADANTTQVTIEGLEEEGNKSASLFRTFGVERGSLTNRCEYMNSLGGVCRGCNQTSR
jgi:hypothetical protein